MAWLEHRPIRLDLFELLMDFLIHLSSNDLKIGFELTNETPVSVALTSFHDSNATTRLGSPFRFSCVQLFDSLNITCRRRLVSAELSPPAPIGDPKPPHRP